MSTQGQKEEKYTENNTSWNETFSFNQMLQSELWTR